MKLKKAIEILDDHNQWRRWNEEYTHTNPKELWIAIDTIIEDYEDLWLNEDSDIENTNEYLASSISELQFANLQRDYLLNILNEVEAMTTDKLAKWVITNWIERYNMDLMIHTRILFDNE